MKNLQIIIFFAFLVTSVSAMDIRKSVVEYYQKVPQEKLFLHTDKDQYVAGDTVWFRAHLVDALTMMNSSESRYVYIELYDGDRKLLERHMVKKDSLGVFANALRLSPLLPTGAYTLMAYTQWMQNFPNKRFFYKPIMIADKDTKSIPSADQEATYVGDTLPAKVQSEIKVLQRNEYLYVSYISDNPTQNNKLSLAIYGSGNIIVVDSLTSKPVSFLQKELCPGTVNIAVVDRETGSILAERLAFVKGAGLPQVTTTIATANDYKTLDFTVTNMEGTPIAGDFSISVTDADIVEKDTTQQNIATYMLAGSEVVPLDASIPQWRDMRSMTDIHRIDNYISQYGDQRFSLADMLRATPHPMKYDIQRDQRISGIVQGTLRKKIKNPRILLLNPASGTLDRYELPSNSHFNLTDMDFQEGASFMLEATRNNGSNGFVELKIDEQPFPAPYAISTFVNKRILTDDFLKYERMQAAINGLYGMNYLAEVEVNGTHKPAEDRASFEPRKSYDRERDGAPLYKDIIAWLRSMGYIIHIHQGRIGQTFIGPAVYIDGFVSDLEELATIDPDHVKRLNYYLERNGELNLPSVLTSAFDAGEGIIYVETDYSKESAEDHPLAIKTIHPQGYMSPRNPDSFLRPREQDRIDMRTTLFWSPYVKLSEDGKASVKFYPSDTSKRYRVTIQGISANGQVICKEIEL